MATKKENRIVIDNSNNYFNLNEVVQACGRKNKQGKRLYKSLERNFEAFINDEQTLSQKTQ